MDNNPQSINIIRTFDAPIEMVWKAWTTPEGFSAWYGQPWEVPSESVEMDVKAGGRWKSTTIAQGNTINFTGEFKVIEEPHSASSGQAKLVMTVELADMQNTETPPEIVTVLLKDIGDHKTEMNFTQSGNLPPEEYKVGLKDGWTGFFDALEKYLSH